MATATAVRTDVRIPLAVGEQRLVGTWCSPQCERPRATVVIAPAMATTAGFYLPFAAWLAQQGFEVLTFDYRGYGKSSDDHELKDVAASALDWADDAKAAVAYAHSRNPDVPTVYLGHSFGGQLVPLLDADDFDAAVLVAAGSGFWQRGTLKVRLGTPILWWFLSPALIATVGYFPGRRIGVVGDLPPRVMEQWSRWCRSPRYITSESEAVAERFRRFSVPTTSIWFADDEILGERSFRDFAGYFPEQSVDLEKVSPSDLDVARIGHHGIFRSAHEINGWPRLLLPHIERAAARNW